MNSLDLKIIKSLMQDARIKWSTLAKQVGLSAPATADRVQRLQDQGIIRRFETVLDPALLGYDLGAFVAVSLERPEHRDPFLQRVQELPYILECHHIAGEDDYLLKIRCRNTEELDDIITNHIKSLHGISRTKTTIIMRTLKESTALPLLPED
ncbi:MULTISPECIES: Lrp/AsnC family transcriptional regulator [Exiguobacterium]|uniref:Lrp/AsnC family transcriptional regulator n=1 Tax=Exiguobacterium TaxID=33986 RepID=UPI00047BDED1|nr:MULTISPECIES: Lrp/AsnC family transcriptional regulator [Exiguobacterium]MCK2158291.1 Lrp/AsnC family transcriptional regulator [Exiguobacterium sp. 17-1]